MTLPALCVCACLCGSRSRTFAPASTKSTRVLLKSRSSTPPSCRLPLPIKVSMSPKSVSLCVSDSIILDSTAKQYQKNSPVFTVCWTFHMSTKTTEQTWRGQTQYVAGVWWVVCSLTWETYQMSVPLVMSQVGLFTSISSGRWRQLKSKLKGGKFVPQTDRSLTVCLFLFLPLSFRNTR